MAAVQLTAAVAASWQPMRRYLRPLCYLRGPAGIIVALTEQIG